MRDDITPFERHEVNGKTILWLHGESQYKPATVDKCKVSIILDAIAEGWNIDICYSVIYGSLNIMDIDNKLDRDEEGRLIINGNITISFSSIRGYTDFTRVTFIGNVDFTGTLFCNACFGDTIFIGTIDFCGAIFNGAIFSLTKFRGNAYFNETTFNGIATFNTASFYSDIILFSDVRMDNPADFYGVHFLENTVFKGLWNLTFGRIKCLHWTVTDFIGFNTATVMDGSSNPYLKRYIDDELWIQSWRNRSWWRQILFVIWELTSHCGRSFILWMSWSIAIAFLFGVIYSNYDFPSWLSWFPSSWRPEFYISASGRIPTGFTYYYFSIVAFTTLGFGDITPLNLAGEIWLAIEVVLGYIMLGGLLSIFANKLARRS